MLIQTKRRIKTGKSQDDKAQQCQQVNKFPHNTGETQLLFNKKERKQMNQLFERMPPRFSSRKEKTV
jgi:hypothetical protein